MQYLAQIIGRILDFCHQPFKKWLSKQLFRYAVCGGGNMVLDWILYFVLYNYVIGHELQYVTFLGTQWCITPHILCLCIVFPITLLTGFWLNKYITFTQSTLKGSKQLGRYVLIVICNLLLNYFGLKLFVEGLGWYPTPSKMCITAITVVISFLGQKYYSFRK